VSDIAKVTILESGNTTCRKTGNIRWYCPSDGRILQEEWVLQIGDVYKTEWRDIPIVYHDRNL